MFKTNRKLRVMLLEHSVALAAAKQEGRDAVAAEKARADALSAELYGTPRQVGPWVYVPAVEGVKQRLERAQRELDWRENSNRTLAAELARLQRHNAALREALTALGGAVIELQDHVEVHA